MGNINHEQVLIDAYWKHIKTNQLRLINKKCRSKDYSDLEYIDIENNIRWRIEAKSHMSKDRHNAVHKLFGELLKETGRLFSSENELKYGLLLDGRYCPDINISGKDFFEKYFKCINTEKYKKFGLLIPINDIIVYDVNMNNVKNYNWNSFIGEKDD